MKKKYFLTDRDCPNKDKEKPVFLFRANCDPEKIIFLKNLQSRKELSEWISRAIEFLYWYEHQPKGFIINIIEYNFELCKHLLRKIGRTRK